MDSSLPARQQHDLDDLRWHWPVYTIGAFVTENGRAEIWTAAVNGEVICAKSAAALRLKIRAHYDEHPELKQRGEAV